MYCVGDLFWIWVPQWVSYWRQPNGVCKPNTHFGYELSHNAKMRRLSPTTQSSCAGSGGPRCRGGVDDDDVLPRTTMARRGGGRVRTVGWSHHPPEPRQGGLSYTRREASAGRVTERGSSGGVSDVVESVVGGGG
jgi:hypothetical protein